MGGKIQIANMVRKNTRTHAHTYTHRVTDQLRSNNIRSNINPISDILFLKWGGGIGAVIDMSYKNIKDGYACSPKNALSVFNYSLISCEKESKESMRLKK